MFSLPFQSGHFNRAISVGGVSSSGDDPDGVTHAARDQQYQADDHQDDSGGPEQADIEEVSGGQQDGSEDDHGLSPVSCGFSRARAAYCLRC